MPRLVSTLALRSIVLLSFLDLCLTSAHAANRATRTPSQSAASFHSWMSGVLRSQSSFAPNSPDNWLGGSSGWDNAAFWSAGEPGTRSDVYINTGNDTVVYDVNASINSLTLGGSSGSSVLQETLGRGLTLSITGPLTINPTGTLTFTHDGLFAGINSSNAGTMNFHSNARFQVGTGFTNSGTINLMTNSMMLGDTVTNSGMINGLDGGIDVLQVNSLTNSGAMPIYGVMVNGSATNQAGGLIAAQYLTVAGDLMNQGGVMGLTRGSQLTVDGQLTNSGTFDYTYANAALGSLNNLSGGLLRGGGEMTVNGDALNAGAIVLYAFGPNEPSVSFHINGSLTNSGTVGVSGAFEAPAPFTVSSNVNNTGGIQVDSGALFGAGGTLTNSGTIKTGLQGGGNSLGATTLMNQTGGMLSLGGMGDVAGFGYINNAGSISIANGATLQIASSHSPTTALPGFLNSATVLIAQGGLLTSPLTYAQTGGQTTVDGTLHVGGFGNANFSSGAVYGNGGTIQANVISNAAFNVGDMVNAVGQMAIMGNYTQGANGSLTFDIASLTQYDQLNVSGHAGLNGTLFVDLINGYVPQIGNMFDIMNFSGSSGTFSMVLGLPINNQEHFVLEYNSTNLTLDVVSGPELEASTGHSRSSGHNSSYTEPYITPGTEQALNLAAASYAGGSTVPEPGSLVLLASGILGVAARSRRSRAFAADRRV